MTERLADITIIGAGVVGLAVAAELADAGRDVLLVERNDSFGRETSSRNSEVIHGGLYYAPGSLKAHLCVEGRERLYRYCREHDIPHSRMGKLVVASSDEEIPRLEKLAVNARRCGVEDVQMLPPADIQKMEPHVRAQAALYSPSTGILDTHSLMKSLERAAKAKGAMVSYYTEVTALEPTAGGFTINVKHPGEEEVFETGAVINCAGLGCEEVARMAGIDTMTAGYHLHYCKGCYFSVHGGKSRYVTRLVYPAPQENALGLGIHWTLDLNGQARLGPNTFYVDKIDYQVDEAWRIPFYESASRHLPFLSLNDLEPGMAGIRPKLQGPGEGFHDFVIRHEADRGLPGLINLIGIESPGLTSALAIARYVSELAKDAGLI